MKILYYFILLQLLASFALSEVLFEESFTDLQAYENSADARILNGSLDFKFHYEKGNRLEIADNKDGIIYKLDRAAVDGTAHKSLYLSFCYRNLSQTVKDKFSGLFLYHDGKEVLGLGNDYSGETYSFWLSDGRGISIGEIPTFVDGEIHKIVMRIDFNPSGAEKIKIGLDPFCRRSESRQPQNIWTEYQCQLDFDEIRLRSGNNGSVCEIDEILIGTDFSSVSGSDDNPGLYINTITENKTSANRAEVIGDDIARFWPCSQEISAGFQSFVLESPRKPTGSLPAGWKLKPEFGTFGEQRYVYLDIAPETDLYGTGEVAGRLLRNGYKITLFNRDNYNYNKPDQLYQSHPWVLGLRQDGSSFGVIFDSTWKAQLDLRAGILFTTDASAMDFPVIVIEGASPQEVMSKLGQLSGTMPMPPRWALGYQQCRYSYYPDSRVREIADTFRAKQIPCDVIWFDIDYMDGFRIFTFDPNQFPEPKATNDYLHSLGFKSIWMIDPGVKVDSNYFVYNSGSKADVWVKDAHGKPFIGPVWPGDCVFPDFTSPSVCLWWAGLYEPFLANGIDGVWNDMCEPAVFSVETNGTMPLDCVHRGGGKLQPGLHVQYHNVYGMLMAKATRQGIKKAQPDKRPFVLVRANFLGGHRYAATWTGDNNAIWQHLKWSIPMSLNLSLSGQPFNGPDIGGFIGDASPELWAHWISVGAFYPFSRAHSAKGTTDQEPWSFGEKTESAARIALQSRYRLIPYLYTVFRQAHLTGLPVMRPLFFADAADISLRMADNVFLLGSDIMVIPKWAESVPMPKGIWRSAQLVDNDCYSDTYQCDIKIRGGSIIPLGPVVQTTEEITLNSPLSLIVVLDEYGRAAGELYEDTGQGYGYLNNEYYFSTFRAEKRGKDVFIICNQKQNALKRAKRLATIIVLDENGRHYGFGDVIGGAKVILE